MINISPLQTRLYGLILLLLLVACSSEPDVVVSSEIPFSKEATVWVVSHGWHTGFVLPAESINTLLPDLAKRFPDSEWLEIGWGDKYFYQAEENTLTMIGIGLKAIFWPTDAVAHVVGFNGPVERYFSHSEVLAVCLKKEQMASLLDFLVSSFHSKNAALEMQQAGLYGDSQFYTASGEYYLMNTCNKWTAKGLKSAGIDIVPTFKLSASSVMSVLKANSASCGALSQLNL